MSTSSHSSKPSTAVASAAFRLRVKVGDTIAIGPGKVALLEAVAATGSITAAAKSLGMSYRRAWLLIEELDGQLRTPAVESTKGGAGGRAQPVDRGGAAARGDLPAHRGRCDGGVCRRPRALEGAAGSPLKPRRAWVSFGAQRLTRHRTTMRA